MKVVFCDIDNALADTTHRDNLMFEKKWDEYNAMCGLDKPIYECINLLSGFYERGYSIVLVSGRSETTLVATSEWLLENGAPYHKLFLRPIGDRTTNKAFKMGIIRNYLKATKAVFAVAIEPMSQTANVMAAHPDRPLVLRVTPRD